MNGLDDTPPPSANTTEVSSQEEGPHASSVNLSNLFQATGHSGTATSDPSGEMNMERSAETVTLEQGSILNIDEHQPPEIDSGETELELNTAMEATAKEKIDDTNVMVDGTKSKTGKFIDPEESLVPLPLEPESTHGARPHNPGDYIGKSRSERGSVMERVRENQEHKALVEKYQEKSKAIKDLIEQMSNLMQTSPVNKGLLQARKLILQGEMIALDNFRYQISSLCNTPYVEEDFSIVVASGGSIVNSYRDLYPKGPSMCSSSLTSSVASSRRSASSNQAYKEMVGKQKNLGEQKALHLVELDEQKKKLRRQQEALEEEEKRRAKNLEKEITDKQRQDQEELDAEQDRLQEQRRQDEAQREDNREALRREKDRRERERLQYERRMKEGLEAEMSAKVKAVKQQIDEIDEQKTAVSQHFDQQANQAAQDMIAEIEQGIPPPPDLKRVNMVDVLQNGVGTLNGIKDTVLRDEEDKRSRLSSQVSDQQKLGDRQVKQPVVGNTITSTMSAPGKSSTPMQSFNDPPISSSQKKVQIGTTSTQTLNGPQQHPLSSAHPSNQGRPQQQLPRSLNQTSAGNKSQQVSHLTGSRQSATQPVKKNSNEQTVGWDSTQMTRDELERRYQEIRMQIRQGSGDVAGCAERHQPLNHGTSSADHWRPATHQTAYSRPLIFSSLPSQSKPERVSHDNGSAAHPDNSQGNQKSNLNVRASDFHPYQTEPQWSNPGSGNASMITADHVAATNLVAAAIQRSTLPTQEPTTFSGDPLLYTAWRYTFALLIESQDISDIQRLLYLQKYVSGAAKDAISSSFVSASPTAYSTAMNTLDQRFGSSFVITTAYREKLEAWPHVGVKDADGLRKLSDFLGQFLSATQLTGQASVFDDVQYQLKVLDKLPDWVGRKWQRIYSEKRQKAQIYSTFAAFVQFIQDEAIIANEPGWNLKSKSPANVPPPSRRGNNALNTRTLDTQNEPGWENKLDRRMKEIKQELASELRDALRSTIDLQTSPPASPSWSYNNQTSTDLSPPSFQRAPMRNCAHCDNSGHNICECEIFIKLTPEQKQEEFYQKKLCFRCGRTGHRSMTCKFPRSCQICRKKHPTAFHARFALQDPQKPIPPNGHQMSGNQNQGTTGHINDARLMGQGPAVTSPNEPAQSGNNPPAAQIDPQVQEATKVDTLSVQRTPVNLDIQAGIYYNGPVRTTMVVPVYVSSELEPKREILTYALLDTQSCVTFVADELVKQMKTQGYDHQLRINTMTAQNKLTPTKAIVNLRIRAVDSSEHITLPTSFATDILTVDPLTIPTPEIAEKYEHLKHLKEHIHPFEPKCIAGLLIGYDNPEALMPIDLIKGEPYAVETKLGWTIIGELRNTLSIDDQISSPSLTTTKTLMTSRSLEWEGQDIPQVVGNVYRTTAQEATTADLLNLMESDFVERETGSKSQEDTQFIEFISEEIRVNEAGYYEMPLPFKNGDPRLPCNRSSAVVRLGSLKRQLLKDQRKRDLYSASMEKLLEQGHAERVPEDEICSETRWYIPHHGVFNEKKPDKIRVVFDCSAQHKGTCLNDHLLQGPDLINPLIGVLLRFRKGKIAISCDIRQMYHQFYVREDHRDYFRFLWWENGDLDGQLVDYRMKVHIFGATSSPGCANFGLKRIAQDHQEVSQEAAKFLQEDFYVDDGLHSSDDVKTATQILTGAREICEKAMMKLHKITSNNQELLTHFPEEDLAQTSCRELGVDETSSVERILGLQWSTQEDIFTFPNTSKEKPLTKRGMLSTVAALYDPLGFVSPLILKGRILLQKVCREKGDWDDPLPQFVVEPWKLWLQELSYLDQIKIPRSFIPPVFGLPIKQELHHFSDASEAGYGQCSYLRLQDEQGRVHCSLVMAKSRVTPLKTTTIPRLELQAATLSVKMSKFLDDQLHIEGLRHYFWTDSSIVLAYLANKTKRFHVFVANRVGEILRQSKIEQWAHVPTEKNPADIASRGATATELDQSTWYRGPEFLWQPEVARDQVAQVLPDNDPEINVRATAVTRHSSVQMDKDFQHASSWRRLVGGMTTVFLKWSTSHKNSKMSRLELEEIVAKRLIKAAQNEFLSNPPPPLSNLMKQLSCQKNSEGLVVVGGRSKKTETNPVLLPRESHLTKLIVENTHKKQGHAGRTTTIHHIRKQGFWVIGFRRVVGHTIKHCSHCIRSHGKTMTQRMSDLPSERTSETLPFHCCGLDCFGPFQVKDARKTLKRYGLIITCLSTRAVHIELLDDMTTDAFLNALRNVIAIRGNIRYIRSDRGTNFVGASRELRRAWVEMSKIPLRQALLKDHQCEWVFNSATASHTGGVWERLIRSARRILNGLLVQTSASLTTSTLRTLLYEVMAIMNSRPLSVESLEDPTGPLPLTPNHILTLKSSGVLPPPGAFETADLDARKLWRRVQHLADLFWERWRRSYLDTLQKRRKWQLVQPNLKVGDVVLMKDDNACRADWKMAIVVHVFFSEDGLVRRCRVKVANPSYMPGCSHNLSPTRELERHVHSLVLFVEFQQGNAMEASKTIPETPCGREEHTVPGPLTLRKHPGEPASTAAPPDMAESAEQEKQSPPTSPASSVVQEPPQPVLSSSPTREEGRRRSRSLSPRPRRSSRIQKKTCNLVNVQRDPKEWSQSLNFLPIPAYKESSLQVAEHLPGCPDVSDCSSRPGLPGVSSGVPELAPLETGVSVLGVPPM